MTVVFNLNIQRLLWPLWLTDALTQAAGGELRLSSANSSLWTGPPHGVCAVAPFWINFNGIFWQIIWFAVNLIVLPSPSNMSVQQFLVNAILAFYFSTLIWAKSTKIRRKKHFIDTTLGPCPNMVMFPFKKQNISIKTLSPESILLIIVLIVTFFSVVLQ